MKVHEFITPDLQAWIKSQKVFFVGSGPLTSSGHVNLSPKGNDCFRILDDHTVCYMDMPGSGNETSAHIQENGRLTLMFCAFTGPPRILRLYGRGQVILRENTAEWEAILDKVKAATREDFPILPATRQIIVNNVHKVTTSCGYSVPKFDYVKDRTTGQEFVASRHDSDPELKLYQKEHNLKSMDGLVTPLGLHVQAQEGGGASGNKRDYSTIGPLLVAAVAVVTVLWAIDLPHALQQALAGTTWTSEVKEVM